MRLKVLVHPAEEGGFWAEVPAVPGCVSQGETMEELLANVRDAIEASLEIEVHHAAGEVEEGASENSEPEFFLHFGEIRVGPGSPVEDVRTARGMRGRREAFTRA